MSLNDKMFGSYSNREPYQKVSDGQFFESLLRTPQQGAQPTIESPDLLKKTKSVRLKNETVLELVARCGISPGQIREMGETQIEHFCAQAVKNRAGEVQAPKSIF